MRCACWCCGPVRAADLPYPANAAPTVLSTTATTMAIDRGRADPHLLADDHGTGARIDHHLGRGAAGGQFQVLDTCQQADACAWIGRRGHRHGHAIDRACRTLAERVVERGDHARDRGEVVVVQVQGDVAAIGQRIDRGPRLSGWLRQGRCGHCCRYRGTGQNGSWGNRFDGEGRVRYQHLHAGAAGTHSSLGEPAQQLCVRYSIDQESQ